MNSEKTTSVLISLVLCASIVFSPVAVKAADSEKPSETPVAEETTQEETSKHDNSISGVTEEPTAKASGKNGSTEVENQYPDESTVQSETTKTKETDSESESRESVKPTETNVPSNTNTVPTESSTSSIPSETSTEKETIATESSIPETKARRKASNSYTGNLGPNITWTIDDEGILTISGTGALDIEDAYDEEHRKFIWGTYATKAKKVIVENGITSICMNSFMYFDDLISVTLPDSLTSIGENAFEGCQKLKSVNIPSGVTQIDFATFKDTGIVSITIPKSVTKIGGHAFWGCSELTDITIPNTLTSIGSEAFRGCISLKNIDVPNSVISIGDEAFSYCSSLSSISIPIGLTVIDEGLFSYCENLKSVTIPDGVKTIRANAFLGCKSLTSIVIPNSVTEVGWWAFCECDSLKSVTISKKLYDDTVTNNWGMGSAAIFENESSINFIFSTQAANTLTVKGKTAKVKYKKLRKRNQTLSVSKVIAITKKGQGNLIYAKVSGNKKILINKTTGKVTVKKKLKKKTYTVKVKVMASGNAQYKSSGWKTVKFKIKVK